MNEIERINTMKKLASELANFESIEKIGPMGIRLIGTEILNHLNVMLPILPPLDHSKAQSIIKVRFKGDRK